SLRAGSRRTRFLGVCALRGFSLLRVALLGMAGYACRNGQESQDEGRRYKNLWKTGLHAAHRPPIATARLITDEMIWFPRASACCFRVALASFASFSNTLRALLIMSSAFRRASANAASRCCMRRRLRASMLR